MPAPFVDVHTHQTYYPITEVINICSLRLCQPIPKNQLYTLGLHPWYQEDMTEKALDTLLTFLQKTRPWGIGEAGIDKLSAVPMNVQIHYLDRQIQLSEELQLPLVIHCVRAWGELLRLRKGCRMPWIVHGFRGKATLAEQLIHTGCHLSLGKYYNPEVLDLIHRKDRLFLETDTNDLDISQIYQQAASLLRVSLDNLRADLFQRFCALSA
ncbi:MAG: TatD family hydrolase [Porphyromonadaceae bacterium]|nr:TatD family hydrolase [Porphyromonadaceae bacterium]